MADLQKYEPLTMPFDMLIELHSRGERIACPVCGNELQINCQPRPTAFCPVNRTHFNLLPSMVGDREELDAMFDKLRQP